MLGAIGLFIAGVLSLEAASGLIAPCGGSGGCAKVASDASSTFFFGIPNAYIGVVGYLILIGLAAARALRPTSQWKTFVTLGYVVASIGALASIGLQYYSLVYIKATCIWCLSSAIVMVVTLIVYAMLAQEMEDLAVRRPEPVAESLDMSEAPVAPPSGFSYRVPFADQMMMLGVPLVALIGVGIMSTKMDAKDVTPQLDPEIEKRVEFVPKGANMLGSHSAPLTIVEFADLCCPACKRLSPQVKEFVAQHPDQVRLIYRHYPLQMHEQSMPAAVIAECMADDSRFWDYAMNVMALDHEPKTFDELISVAKGLGANEEKLRKRIEDTSDPAYTRLARDLDAVKKLGINSTPTFFLMANGKVVDVVGPTQILKSLESDKYKKIMSGSPANE